MKKSIPLALSMLCAMSAPLASAAEGLCHRWSDPVKTGKLDVEVILEASGIGISGDLLLATKRRPGQQGPSLLQAEAIAYERDGKSILYSTESIRGSEAQLMRQSCADWHGR